MYTTQQELFIYLIIIAFTIRWFIQDRAIDNIVNIKGHEYSVYHYAPISYNITVLTAVILVTISAFFLDKQTATILAPNMFTILCAVFTLTFISERLYCRLKYKSDGITEPVSFARFYARKEGYKKKVRIDKETYLSLTLELLTEHNDRFGSLPIIQSHNKELKAKIDAFYDKKENKKC